jgi:hypothetical protein
VAAVVLPPRQRAADQRVHRRHLLGRVVVRAAEVGGTEEAEGRLRADRRHEAPLLIEPEGVALLGHAVADERRPRRAERDQLMGVDRDVVRGLAAERRLAGAVLQEGAGHPVVLAAGGEVLDRLAEVAAMELGAAFAGRADEDDREALVEGHRDERRLPVARHAVDADALGVDRRVGLEEVERAARAPAPGAQRAPVVRLAPLPLVDEADDPLGEAGAVVGLDAGRVQERVAPAGLDQLLRAGRVFTRPGRGNRLAAEIEGRQAGHLPSAEHDHHRHGLVGLGRRDDDQRHLHLDVGRGAVVGPADDAAAHDRHAADLGVDRLLDLPRDRGHVLRHAADDLALEVLEDLLAPDLPLRLGPDLPAVLEGQQLGQLRVGVRLRLVVVRRVRLVGSRVAPRPQRRDPELLHHVGVIGAARLLDARALGLLFGRKLRRPRRRCWSGRLRGRGLRRRCGWRLAGCGHRRQRDSRHGQRRHETGLESHRTGTSGTPPACRGRDAPSVVE